MLKLTGILSLWLIVISCKDTISYNSEEFGAVREKQSMDITAAEAENIMAKVRTRVEAGEAIDPSLQAIIAMARSKLSAQHPFVNRKPREEDLNAIKLKYILYFNSLGREIKPQFIPGCEGLFYTGMLDASGYNTDIYKAESKDQAGQWFRSNKQNCFSDGKNDATLDHNMILGLALALWNRGDSINLQELIKYAEDNNGYLGEATTSKINKENTYLTTNLSGLLNEILFHITGEDSNLRGYLPEVDIEPTIEQAHQIALKILLRGSMYGGLDNGDFSAIESLADTMPNNALFQMIFHAFHDGDMSSTTKILLDETYFPPGSLPKSSDRCGSYLWLLDPQSKDWEPCPDKDLIHIPVDFMIVAGYLLEEFPQR